MSLKLAETSLATLDVMLESSRFLAGDDVSLADLHAFPMLRYFCLAPEGAAALQPHAALLRWYETMRVRRSVAATVTSYESAR